MANNREISQFGSFITVNDTTGKIGIANSVGIGTTQPTGNFTLDVHGDVNFTGSLFANSALFTSGVGIGSTAINPNSGDIVNRIGVGFTDINFVGTGLSVTGYGSTVVVDFGNISASGNGALSISTVTNPRIQDIAFVGGASTTIIGIATLTDRFVFDTQTNSVGIGTAEPGSGYKLDVIGDINSSTSVKVKGVDILDESVRFAIALG